MINLRVVTKASNTRTYQTNTRRNAKKWHVPKYGKLRIASETACNLPRGFHESSKISLLIYNLVPRKSF